MLITEPMNTWARCPRSSVLGGGGTRAWPGGQTESGGEFTRPLQHTGPKAQRAEAGQQSTQAGLRQHACGA